MIFICIQYLNETWTRTFANLKGTKSWKNREGLKGCGTERTRMSFKHVQLPMINVITMYFEQKSGSCKLMNVSKPLPMKSEMSMNTFHVKIKMVNKEHCRVYFKKLWIKGACFVDERLQGNIEAPSYQLMRAHCLNVFLILI